MPMKKRSDGRYQVSVQIGFNPDTGKPQRKVFYGDTQREAKARRDEFLKNRAIGLKQDRKLTVAKWATKWLAVYGTGGYSTTRSNELAVRRLVAFMGDAALNDVVKSDVQRFADTVRGMSFSSVKKIQMAVQNIFREAVADRLIIFDPTLKVDWSYASKGSHRALSEWEVDLITQHWRGGQCPLPLAAAGQNTTCPAINWSRSSLTIVLSLHSLAAAGRPPLIGAGQVSVILG